MALYLNQHCEPTRCAQFEIGHKSVTNCQSTTQKTKKTKLLLTTINTIKSKTALKELTTSTVVIDIITVTNDYFAVKNISIISE